MQLGAACPACDSVFTLVVQDVVGQRSGRRHEQRFCMDCSTFFHRSGYTESAQQQSDDFDALLQHRDNHAAIMSQLVLELKTRRPSAQTVLEIGHGTGYFLKGCRDYGLTAHGFEVNPYCHRYAVETLGVSSECGTFDESHTATYDLIVAIQVFEHLEAPRQLFTRMRDHLNRNGAIYLSVPFVLREQWPFLLTADTAPGPSLPDPFFDNDVHITHFSVEGMRRMGLGLGARTADYFVSTDTYYRSPGAYHGVLFTF